MHKKCDFLKCFMILSSLSFTALLKMSHSVEWIGPLKYGPPGTHPAGVHIWSHPAGAHLGHGDGVSLSVLAAVSPVPGTGDLSRGTCWIERTETLTISIFIFDNFPGTFLMLSSSLKLDVGHAVGLMFWSFYLLTHQSFFDLLGTTRHSNQQGTSTVACLPFVASNL